MNNLLKHSYLLCLLKKTQCISQDPLRIPGREWEGKTDYLKDLALALQGMEYFDS